MGALGRLSYGCDCPSLGGDGDEMKSERLNEHFIADLPQTSNDILVIAAKLRQAQPIPIEQRNREHDREQGNAVTDVITMSWSSGDRNIQ